MSNDFDKFVKRLDHLQKNAKKINGENQIPFSEMFNQQFMLTHTQNKYSSFDELLSASPFDGVPLEDIPDDKWDKWLSDSTDFQSWKEMQDSAAHNWMVNKLGF